MQKPHYLFLSPAKIFPTCLWPHFPINYSFLLIWANFKSFNTDIDTKDDSSIEEENVELVFKKARVSASQSH